MPAPSGSPALLQSLRSVQIPLYFPSCESYTVSPEAQESHWEHARSGFTFTSDAGFPLHAGRFGSLSQLMGATGWYARALYSRLVASVLKRSRVSDMSRKSTHPRAGSTWPLQLVVSRLWSFTTKYGRPRGWSWSDLSTTSRNSVHSACTSGHVAAHARTPSGSFPSSG